jgi:hypothetical protein
MRAKAKRKTGVKATAGKSATADPRGREGKSGARPRAVDGDFVARAHDALRRHEPEAIPDALLQQVLAAALKVYAAKAERRGVVKPYRDGAVTATESVVAACALIRAADLNLFDVAMWFNRPPPSP